MNKLDYDGILRKQVLNYCKDVPLLIRGFHQGRLEPRFLPEAVLKGLRRILITGSGDCWGAAQILKTVFDDFLAPSGVSCEAYTPMELSRFTELTPNDDSTLIITLSVWGFPARLVEILERAAKYHIPSIAITEKDNSPVGLAAKYVLNVHNSSAALESKSGCGTYLGMLVSASLFAAYIAENRANEVTDPTRRAECVLQSSDFPPTPLRIQKIRPERTVKALEHSLTAYAEKFEKEIASIDESAFAIAQLWKDKVKGVIAIGDDCDYASALFFPAKLIESSGVFGGFTNSREWLRTQKYIRKVKETGVLIYMQESAPTKERLEEAARAAAAQGFPTLVISDFPCALAKEYPNLNNIVLPAAPDGRTYMASFFNHLPADLLASYLCELWGGSYFRSAVIEDTEYGVNHKEGSSIWSKPGINTLQSSKHVIL